MKRRDVLAGTGTLAAASLAGCVASAPGDVPPETDTPSPEPSPTATAAVGDSQFAVTDVSSSDGDGGATVAFGDEVVVEGTIVGSNGCYTARLAEAAVADGTLTVVVEAHEAEGSGMCTQALVDVAYTATVTVAGRTPERVVVEHDRGDAVETVAEATPAEA